MIGLRFCAQLSSFHTKTFIVAYPMEVFSFDFLQQLGEDYGGEGGNGDGLIWSFVISQSAKVDTRWARWIHRWES